MNSKLVCVDGFTVNAITKNRFIRSAMNDKGYSLSANTGDVMKLIYDLVKAEIILDIKSKLEIVLIICVMLILGSL